MKLTLQKKKKRSILTKIMQRKYKVSFPIRIHNTFKLYCELFMLSTQKSMDYLVGDFGAQFLFLIIS